MTAAAESLNLSQSAVSHTIAKLERRFGVKLWHRKGNTLVYSQAGLYLLACRQNGRRV
ncbi:LysR family transcriptional regulator (plasmid) [Pseudoalteromonas espejiana]